MAGPVCPGIVGKSPALRAVLREVEIVAPTSANVLIFGETGTGKELIAQALHDLGPLRRRSFVKVNCAAMPAALLESELFGHEVGALPGAVTRKIGRLELAQGGTLFLDEVGDLPLELQPKLLRVLQEREFVRLGGVETRPVEVRIVAASARDLPRMVEEGQFRSDLFFRLSVFPLYLPALREREGDIALLAHHFMRQYAREMGRPVDSIGPPTLEALTAYHWPGNVRELQNAIERAVMLSASKVLHSAIPGLRPHQRTAVPDAPQPPVVARPGTLADSQREHILKVLQDSYWVVGGPNGAAAQLGLKRTTLISKMEKLGIERRRAFSSTHRKGSSLPLVDDSAVV